MTKLKGSTRLLVAVGLVLAMLAAPAMAWAQAEEPSAPPDRGRTRHSEPPTLAEVPIELQSLWAELEELREQHKATGEALRAQHETNRDLRGQIKEKIQGGCTEELRGLRETHRDFRENSLAPIRGQAERLRQAMRDARSAEDREGLDQVRTELEDVLGEWRDAQGEAHGMTSRLRELREQCAPWKEIISRCRESIAPLREESREIRSEAAELRLARNAAWTNLRDAIEADDMGAAEDALSEIISLKKQIMSLTQRHLELAEEVGEILSATLAEL